MNKESSLRLERGWGSKAVDLKPTSTWRLKVTLETSGEGHMKTLTFKQLPPIVKSRAAVEQEWSIEEFVIDRHGLWKYMPYYKVGDPCVCGPDRGGNYHGCFLLGLRRTQKPEPQWPISELSVEKGKFAP